jgi:segregation and condensation protein B
LEIINRLGIVESLLFAAGDEGLSLKQIAMVLEVDENVVEQIMEELKASYDNKDRGITVVQLAGAYQLATKKANAFYLKKLVETPNNSSLSQAALETLAIVAYKQPITRIEIEEIRGVNSERSLHTLMGKVLIKEIGRSEGTGRAYLYGTTKDFLECFGLKNLEELPPLTEKLEDEFVQEEADLFFGKFQETVGSN